METTGGVYGSTLVDPLCTDPTYKEWKLIGASLNTVIDNCTDPTYKEWKLHIE